jgi:uncharacterized membrane protein
VAAVIKRKPRFLVARLRSSLWVVPMGLVLGMMALGYSLIALDSYLQLDTTLIAGAGVDSARSMLQAVASSMITVAALVFSLTLAVLVQVSGQYTPRVLRNFLRDRLNQSVIGVFLGVFAYCLVVLSAMSERGGLSPLAVSVGFIGALAGVVVLIYFIHHIASSMQAENILAAIEEDAHPVFDRLYPERGDDAGDDASATVPDATVAITATTSGYVQDIELGMLIDIAEARDVVMHVPPPVGDFVAPGQTLVLITHEVDADCAHAIRRAFTLGRNREIQQDPAFGLRQLVDVALKALSPGINDSTNAVMALDRISVLLRLVAARPQPPRQRFRGGRLRVCVERPDFGDMVSLGFDQIRHYGRDNLTVLTRMLGVLGQLHAVACDDHRRALLRLHARHTMETAERNLEAPESLASLRENYRQLGFDTPRPGFVGH